MKTAIKLENVSKTYDKKKVVDDLSFEIEENTIVGFLGLNGAGKTTTFKLINSQKPVTSGCIEIFGQPIDSKNPSKDIKFLQDVPEFYGYMSAKEYLTFICQLNHLDNIPKRVDEALELVDMQKAKNKRISSFSRGMKQRIGIASNIISSPKILLLDEFVSALDPVGRKEVFDLLEKLRGKMTILFSSHVIDDIERVSDKIIIIHEGKKKMDSTIEELREQFLSKVVELEFLNSTDKTVFLAEKEQFPIEELEDKGHLLITVENMEKFQTAIFSWLAEKNIELRNFRIVTPSLEEIFIGSVK